MCRNTATIRTSRIPAVKTIRLTYLAIAFWLLTASVAAAVDDITVLHNLSYSDGVSKSCTLDLAVPTKNSSTPRPAILVIHGGGWLEGDKSSFVSPDHPMPGNILDFAKLGFVAAAINYRMSREAPFPAALEDCQSAVRWLRSHSQEYQIDTNHIGAYGNSAGGHLALLLGMIPEQNKGELSSRVQAAVSDSGPVDLLFQQRQNQLRTVIEMFMGGPPEGEREALYRRASPANYVSDKVAPLLLIYGVVDTQVDVATADQLVTALGRAGCKDVSYFRLAKVDHCPHSLIRIPYLQPVVEQFFLRTLKPESQPSR